jgi:hypothetical protein
MNIYHEFAVIIPFYYDTPERLKNLEELIDMFNQFKILTIVINGSKNYTRDSIPMAVVNKAFASENYEGGEYFNKSKAINIGVEIATKHNIKYVGWHDVDFRLNYEAYDQTFNALYNGDFSDQRIGSYFVRPFSGLFLNVKGYRFDGKFTGEQLIFEEYSKDSPGGALFFNRQKFIEIGGMNENFSGWGYEDDEIKYRILKYGFTIQSLTFTGFHINHPRHSLHSACHPQTIKNRVELDRVMKMTLDELKAYKFSMFAK